MNRRSLSVLATCCSTAVAASILAGCAHNNDAAVKAAIQAAYNRQSAGYISKNPNAVMAECSPRYTELNNGHVDSRAKIADTITGFTLFAQKLDASATVRDVKVHGNTAEVTVDRHFDMLTVPVKGNNDPGPAQHHFISDETNDDMWINEPGQGWKKLKSVTIVSHSSFDGKSGQ